jgi:hypothetical protein
MAGLNTLEASNVVLPKDLVITAQPNIDTNYFTVTAKGLEIDSSYNFQFQWVYADGTVGPWSTSVFLLTPTESVPGAPSVSVPSTSTAYIPVTLSTFPSNALRVDVKITGGDFGIGKVAHSFLGAGTTTIPAAAGVYYVELYTITPTGINGTPTSAFTITVSDNTVPILAPETPDVPTAKAGLASVIVEWNGKKSGGTDFATGSFAGAKVFIGTTAGFVPSNDNWVHTLNFANGSNKVSIGVGTVINKTAGTLLAYGTPYYIKIDTINANGTANNNPVAASGVPVTVSKLPASEISTGTITADNSITAGVSGGQRVVISGSAAPFIIYGTDGTTKLLEYVTGGTTGSLSIKGSGTFTGSLEIGTGNNVFKADPSIGIWLGNSVFGSANFSVSTSGILKANAGSIGGWTITSSSIYSSANSAVNRMSLNPLTPQLSLIIPSSFKIELDPTNGLKFSKISDNDGNTVTSIPFQVSPNGNMALSGSIISTATIEGGTVQGATIQTAASGQRVRIDTTNSILFYDGVLTNTPGSIYANSHAFYFASPGSSLVANSSIQMYGANAGATLANSIRLWSGAIGSTNGLKIGVDEIRRQGAVGGGGTSTELRNIFATQSITDVAGTASGVDDGTIRLNYTVV